MRLPTLERGGDVVDIDPFTIFGLFNKGITNTNRINIITGFAKEFGVIAAVPENFDGIPVLNNQSATFYYFLGDRGERDIDNLWDFFCAAILSKGIAVQLKHGLGREYIPQTEALSSLRGKIDITESIKTQSLLRKQLICTYDDFTVNSYLNRILKSTMELLLHADISKVRKKALRKLMIYFADA